MAQKRMFSKKVTDSDKFLDLPLTTQALYFHLNIHADDDGFVDNTKTIKRMIGASDGDLKTLVENQFIIPFETGVIVIKDWKIHNYIQKDRYQKTVYTEEFKRLFLAENKEYKLLDTKCIQDVSKMDTQNRIDKIRQDKIKLDKQSVEYPAKTENLNFGQFIKAEGLKVNERQMTRLLEYIGLDHMDMELVKEAVRRTTDSGIDNPNYTFKILDSWKTKGILTVEQANKEKEEFQNHKQHRSQSYQQQPAKSNVPEWANEEYKREATEEEKRELEKLLEGMEG